MKDSTYQPTLEQRFRDFYDSLSLDAIKQLTAVYHPDVLFIDPVGEHRGIKKLTSYFENLLRGNSSCEFKIWDLQLTEHTGYVSWTMYFTTPRLAGGSIISVDGASSLKLKNGLISFQRDHYDLGAMVYEHIPVLRTIIRHIRKRMSA